MKFGGVINSVLAQWLRLHRLAFASMFLLYQSLAVASAAVPLSGVPADDTSPPRQTPPIIYSTVGGE